MKRSLPFSVTAFGIAAGLSLASAMVTASADADAISVNVFNDRNNVGPFSQNTSVALPTAQNLNDNSGAATTADFTFTTNRSNFVQTNTDPVDPNRTFMNHWVNLSTITISELPAEFVTNGYDVYIYFDWHNDNTTVSADIVGDAATATFGRDTTLDYTRDANPSFVQATGTTSGTANVSNYFRFDDVTGSSFTANITGASVIPITGFQVVSNIPEPASLALLGLGGLMMMPRRRRA